MTKTETIADLWDASQAAPSTDEGQRISRLVMEVGDVENNIAMTETMLSNLKQERLKLLRVALPEAMAAAGTSLFRTENGQLEVSVETFVEGSLPKEDLAKRQSVLRYIEECGGEGIIKADVILSFGRKNIEAARKAAKGFEHRDDCITELREDAHPQTLKAWARERLRNGLPLDPEKANLWIGKMARIKELKT